MRIGPSVGTACVSSTSTARLTGAPGLGPNPKTSPVPESVSNDSHQWPSGVDFEVVRFQRHLGSRLLLDKKLRDPWVSLLVEGLDWSVAKVAQMLHVTERSVYRMVKGEQTKRDRRKRSGLPTARRRRGP